MGVEYDIPSDRDSDGREVAVRDNPTTRVALESVFVNDFLPVDNSNVGRVTGGGMLQDKAPYGER